MTQFVASQDKVAAIRAKYESIINQGREQAIHTLARIETERPQDYIVPIDGFHFRAASPDQIVIDIGKNGDTRTLALHPHALVQGVEKTNVVGATTHRKLMEKQEQWAADLLALNLNTIYGHSDREHMLVRAVDNQVRGILSDKYRRLDSSPIFENFVRQTVGFGAVPTSGRVYDTKYAVTMTLPTVFDPVPTDPQGLCVVGATLKNSDYGDGKVDMRFHVLRLVCINGLMREDSYSQVHLGKRLTDDFEFSEETYRLDTMATVSAMGDVIKALFDPARIEDELGRVRRASETTVDIKKMFEALRKLGKLSKEEERKVVDTFNTPEVVMLPPGQNLWRASNAISLFAQSADVTPDRALELQQIAGAVLDKAEAQAA